MARSPLRIAAGASDKTAPLPEKPTLDERFGIVPVRYRHDGWVPKRQLAFIEALAECGCVEMAARSVGMTRGAAYALRRRQDAQAFRLAWDAAMDSAVARLSDAALARAIHGVAVPVFHAGEQVGERRVFNERLTMFLLRTRDPVRYGRWIETRQIEQRQDSPAQILVFRITRMLAAAARLFEAALLGKPAPVPEREPLVGDKCGPRGNDEDEDADFEEHDEDEE